MAQQEMPIGIGHREFLRAMSTTFEIEVVMTPALRSSSSLTTSVRPAAGE